MHLQRQRRRAASGAIGALLLTACLPSPPKAPSGFGVHVVAVGNDTARTKFKVVVKGTLELGIRSTIVAMEPDSSLLLATPADIVINKGIGTAVITAADSSEVLAVTPLDPADSARASARGHAVQIARPDSTRHLTATSVPPSRLAPEKSR